MNLWDQPNIPHKGWSYVGIVDLGEECSCDEEVEYEQCQMCGKERIRYIHILEHPTTPAKCASDVCVHQK